MINQSKAELQQRVLAIKVIPVCMVGGEFGTLNGPDVRLLQNGTKCTTTKKCRKGKFWGI